jgi:hypothetical protein
MAARRPAEGKLLQVGLERVSLGAQLGEPAPDRRDLQLVAALRHEPMI